MNPSFAAIAAIQARVAAVSSWAKPPEQVLADLVADQVANPVPAPTMPKPFEADDLVGACSLANRGSLAPYLEGSAAPLIAAQDRAALAAGIKALVDMGFSATDAAAMQAVLDATQPQPGWPATVPQIQATIGRPIDLFDVLQSRPES